MENELIDIVDLNDAVVGTATREQINAQKLPHRIVHILIFNNEGKMALHMRSEQKSFCPLHWCTGAGGYVLKGESYEKAALREFKEEMGVEGPVHALFKDFYEDSSGNKKFITTFSCIYEGEFNPDPIEVSEVRWFTSKDLQVLLKTSDKIHPELKFILEKFSVY